MRDEKNLRRRIIFFSFFRVHKFTKEEMRLAKAPHADAPPPPARNARTMPPPTTSSSSSSSSPCTSPSTPSSSRSSTRFGASSLMRHLTSVRGKNGPIRNARTNACSSSSSNKEINALISGGTSGICFYLADELLKNTSKCTVVVCSRSEKRVDEATTYLKKKYEREENAKKIYGVTCDVSDPNDVERLKEFCANVFECEKYETHWINGAGRVTRNKALHRVPAKEIIESLNANLLGPLLMSRAAIDLATKNPTKKKMTIWQFGFSQFGANLSKSAATHKSTKTGLSQLTKSLNEEMQRENIDNVFVRQMSPGLALTTLLLKDASPISKKIFNALAEEPEVCAEYIAEKMLANANDGDDNKSPIEYLTPLDAVARMVREVPNIILSRGGRHFDNETGQRVKQPNVNYDKDGVKFLPFDESD